MSNRPPRVALGRPLCLSCRTLTLRVGVGVTLAAVLATPAEAAPTGEPAGPATATAAGAPAVRWPRIRVPFIRRPAKAPAKEPTTTPAKAPAKSPTNAPARTTDRAPADSARPIGGADTTGRAAVAAARQGWADSWFWGARAGVLRFGTNTAGMVAAPTVGADWLVTRSRTALLLGADQAFYDRTAGLATGAVGEPVLPVRIRDARRYSATVLASPVAGRRVRPYAGVGMALEVIGQAQPVGTGADATDPRQAQVDEAASRIALHLLGGAQAQWGRWAGFAQASLTPARTRGTLWNRGQSATLQLGVRLNAAPSVDRW